MAMDMKNIWYCSGVNPHGESHISEKHGGLDCGGGGTRQQRTRHGHHIIRRLSRMSGTIWNWGGSGCASVIRTFNSLFVV